MSRFFRHPEFCDQYQVTANDNGSFFVEDVDHPLAYLNVKSWDDLNRLADLIIVALSMTLPIPEQVGEASDDVPF